MPPVVARTLCQYIILRGPCSLHRAKGRVKDESPPEKTMQGRSPPQKIALFLFDSENKISSSKLGEHNAQRTCIGVEFDDSDTQGLK